MSMAFAVGPRSDAIVFENLCIAEYRWILTLKYKREYKISLYSIHSSNQLFEIDEDFIRYECKSNKTKMYEYERISRVEKLFTFDEHISQKVTCIIILHSSKEWRSVFNETRERKP